MELRCFKSQFDSPSSLLLSDPRLSQCLVSAALKRQSQIENRFLHNPFLILAKGYVRSSKISLEVRTLSFTCFLNRCARDATRIIRLWQAFHQEDFYCTELDRCSSGSLGKF
ncbi:hypothetical protein KC19_4G187500 [Ceratodon purpureus]|uniref:Uncharacterized protein n=1 Tax=Ceratodon purpureus TaxID=3225 RepID=A0A8T0IA43_CERPU|nr:hypothetical protein KC19_4G187500 [Ceratodon purpureus]